MQQVPISMVKKLDESSATANRKRKEQPEMDESDSIAKKKQKDEIG